MEAIKSLEMYDSIISGCNFNKKTFSTNMVLSAIDINKLINMGRLYFEKSDDYLWIIADRWNEKLHYYFTDNLDWLELIETDYNYYVIVIDRVEKINSRCELLGKFGLDMIRESVKMSIRTANVNIKESNDYKTDACAFNVYNANQYRDLLFSHLEKGFSHIEDYVPDKYELNDYMSNRFVLFADDAVSKEMTGFIVFSINGKIATIDFFYVLEKYRCIGIGSKLLDYFICYTNSNYEASKVELWVNSENSTAVNVYKKCGFSCSNLLSRTFEYNIVRKN